VPLVGRGRRAAQDPADVVGVDPGLEQALDEGGPQRLPGQARVGEAHLPVEDARRA
jgi:hypothetical protein